MCRNLTTTASPPPQAPAGQPCCVVRRRPATPAGDETIATDPRGMHGLNMFETTLQIYKLSFVPPMICARCLAKKLLHCTLQSPFTYL